MCFFTKQTKTAIELQNRFKAKLKEPENFTTGNYNGFDFPKTPVITNEDTTQIQFLNWGLIPVWAKDETIRKNTLNARIETIYEKPTFKSIVKNRCLIIANGFYEWQWLDEKGKQKQKYLISLPDNELIAFAGLWSLWQNKTINQTIGTYTILTTEANELMSKIHNTKKRMPLIISQENEFDWLAGKPQILQNERLIATKIN